MESVDASRSPRAVRLLRLCASPRVTVYGLLWLAVLTVAGTLYQARVGLYAATRVFFDSWFFFPLPFLPLPAAQTALAALTVNLAASMAVRFRRTASWIGLWMAHAGLLALIAGGLSARFQTRETVIELAEGERTNFSVAPTEWQLALRRDEPGRPPVEIVRDLRALREGETIRLGDPPVEARVEAVYANCRPMIGPDTGRIVDVFPAARASDPEQDRPGVVLTLRRGAEAFPARLVAGGPVEEVAAGAGRVAAGLRQAAFALPFDLRLVRFEKEFHPHSATPRHFASVLRIEGPGLGRDVTVAMNRPFRHGHLTFYQMSYRTRADGMETTLLSVVRAPGRILPYVATALTSLGLAIHFIGRGVRRRAALAAAAMILLAPAAGSGAEAGAAAAGPVDAVRGLPVLVGGRVMPLDTLARQKLLQFSGRPTVGGEDAAAWAARAILDPMSAARDRVFVVNNPEAAEALGLAPSGRRQWASLEDLHGALPKLAALCERDGRGGGEAPDSAADRDLRRVAGNVAEFMRMLGGRDLRVIPGPGERWHTPGEWEMGDADASWREAGQAWEDLRAAWAERRAGDARAAAGRLRAAGAAASPDPRAAARLDWELALNRLAPFRFARYLCGTAFLLSLWVASGAPRAVRRAALALTLAALALMTAGLALRGAIMGRPPVTNLYSTFVFTAWTCALVGALFEWRQRNGIGVLSAGLGGFAMLTMSARYEAAGDVMARVVAVLASNLWLSAHVLTIMIGFGGCLMAAVAGHVYLVRRWRRPDDAAGLVSAAASVYGLLALGFSFSFVGTMLGGVWADLAWGRFWGWDPKENGALVVLLGCSVLLHARASRLVGERGFAAGAVAGGVVVMLAWQGVNLLGVGLHAYGRASGTAYGLLAYALAEAVFLTAMRPLTRDGRRRGPAPPPGRRCGA
jgi:ABC-type transport system involved in cytochrome c biogenesis permease subunit